MPELRIAIITAQDDSRVKDLARQLNVPIIDNKVVAHPEYDFLLCYRDDCLELYSAQLPNIKPLCIDFLAGKVAFRQKHRLGQEWLIRSLGGSPQEIKVIDATAGLGVDAFVMASYGYDVTMIEQSPILHALLQDGLYRLQQETDKFSNLKLINANSIDHLQALSSDLYPEVIYLDPMFPERKKTALVKKELRIVRDLVGDQHNDAELFSVAKSTAKNRVVVKRPTDAPTLTAEKPTFSYEGKTCRFDVYINTI